jgi:hypothetical protein
MAADGPLAVSFEGELWLAVFEVAVGFGRTVALETDAPNLFVNLVCSGWAVLQSDNATEP